MKKYFLITLCFITANIAFAQSDAVITSIIKTELRIELTVKASEQFYFGANDYILHIGKKEFSLNKQTNDGGRGVITFYIPIEEFNTLFDGDYVWMSYGNVFKTNPDVSIDPATFCEKNSKVLWALGKLNKKLK